VPSVVTAQLRAVSRAALAIAATVALAIAATVALAIAATVALAAPAAPAAQSPVFPLAPAWSFTLPAPPAAAAAFDGRHAYVPLRNGQLLAVSLGTGETAWSVDQSTSLPPVTGDGLVFVATSEAVVALAASDGAARWRVPLGEPPSTLYWLAGQVVAGSDSGEVLVVRAPDGGIAWRQSLGSPLRARPAVDGDLLLLPLDGRLAARALATGAPRWDRQLPGTPGDPVASGDRVFVGCTDNYFYCLARADGRVRWRWRTGADIVGHPVVFDGTVCFLSLDNMLRALNEGNGVQRWATPLGNRPSFGPLPMGDLLLTAGVAPVLSAFRALDGAPAGTSTAPGDLASFAGPPYVVDGLVGVDVTIYVVSYVVTGPGQLLALRPAVTAIPAPPSAVPVSGSSGPGCS
jgi:outer membrane protein assembly factor BamB